MCLNLRLAWLCCGLALLVAACATESACPRTRIQLDDACVCDTGYLEHDGRCIRESPSPAPEQDDDAGDGASTGNVGSPAPDASGFTNADGTAPGTSAGGPSTSPTPGGPEAAAPSGMEQQTSTTAAGSPPVGQSPPSSEPEARVPPEPNQSPSSRPGVTASKPAGTGDVTNADSQSCDDGNTDPNDACVGHVKARCGDERLQVDVEECEIGLDGWTAESCRDCVRTRYTECGGATNGGCPNGRVVQADGTIQNDYCHQGVCAPYGCNPLVDPGCKAPCPQVPGSFLPIMEGPFCVIECLADWNCPKGLRCDTKTSICRAPNHRTFR